MSNYMKNRNEVITVLLYEDADSDNTYTVSSRKRTAGLVADKYLEYIDMTTEIEEKIELNKALFIKKVTEFGEGKVSEEDIVQFHDKINSDNKELKEKATDLRDRLIEYLFDEKVTMDELKELYAFENEYSFGDFLSLCITFCSGTSLKSVKGQLNNINYQLQETPEQRLKRLKIEQGK